MASRRSFIIGLALVSCGAATALAATRPAPPSIDYVPAYRFDQIRSFAKGTGTNGGTVAVALDQQTSYMLVRRTTESDVEEHSRWDALGARESRVLHVGDMARIPAGVPHAFVPSGTEPWELLIVKVRRPHLPLKRHPD
jgi:hypothetical protein